MSSVLVTGANRGLGLEFTRQYAAEGWRVYAGCRNPKQASELRRLAETSKGLIEPLQLDVTDSQSVKNAAAQVGDASIDVLINGAGINGPSRQRVGNVDYDSWAEILNVNTLGVLRVTETFVENVARSERKVIVTITSGMGSIEDNTSGGSIPYRSSKAAVNMVMRSAAIELRPRGITCVVINPGWVQTDMGGPSAPLTPAESIAGMRRVIQKLTVAQSGKFLNYDGREYPW